MTKSIDNLLCWRKHFLFFCANIFYISVNSFMYFYSFRSLSFYWELYFLKISYRYGPYFSWTERNPKL